MLALRCTPFRAAMDQLDLPPLLADSSSPSDDGGGRGDAPPEDEQECAVLLGGADADMEDFAGQLCLPPPLEIAQEAGRHASRASFPTASSRAAYARACLALKRSQAKASSSGLAAAAAREDLQLACSVLPQAARLLGRSTAKKRVLVKTARKPVHFCGIAFAIFLPARLKLNVGMNRKRLICAGARFMTSRQTRGLAAIMATAAQSRNNTAPERRPCLIGAYSHEWDESRALFRRFDPKLKAGARVGAFGVHEQTLVQRGTFHINASSGLGAEGCFSEEWIVPPMIVQGTAAIELLPGLRAGMPSDFLPQAPASRKVSGSFDYFVFSPIGDKASSNLSILKVWGRTMEENLGPEAKSVYLYFPETCQVHAHHRGKLQLHSLRFHTSRLFSISNLMRLPSMQSRVAAALEAVVQHKLIRKLQPPPAANKKLRVFFEVLFGEALFGDDFRPSPGCNKQLQRDIKDFLEALNGDPADDRLTHFCQSEAGELCCSNIDDCRERVTVAVLNLLLGGDTVPCESRWTHLLPNIKKILMRLVVRGIGGQCFCGNADLADAAITLEGDDAAKAEYFKQLMGVRCLRASEYYGDPSTKQQLGVLVVVLGVADKLLYAMLGGVDRRQAPCKVAALLDRRTSLIGEALSGMLGLLEHWATSDKCRKPWSILDLLGAPVEDGAFALWGRCQVLRMAASLHRRYEAKYSAWPYRLHKLCDEEYTTEEQEAIAQEACRAPRCCLDTFTASFRTAFPTPVAMMSPKGKQVLKVAFSSLRLSTDFCERQHAEVQATRPVRSGARDFSNFARESIIKQARVVHMHNGGQDPVAPEHVKASASKCKALVAPFLPAAQDALRSLQGVPAASDDDGQPDVEQSRAVVPRQQDALVSPGLGPSAVALASELSPLFELVSMTLAGGAEEGDLPAEGPPQKKSGLNPYLAFKNNFLKAAKEAGGGRKLSAEEVASLTQQARTRWLAMEDRSAHEALYQLWRETPRGAPQDVGEPAYHPIWGGGVKACPISAAELWQMHQEVGWPRDEEVYSAGAFHVNADLLMDVDAGSGFDLWGCPRSATAVCLATVANTEAFNLVHSGVCNYLEFLPRAAADNGDVMLLVEGTLKASPGSFSRDIIIVAGTCWSPRAFDLVRCRFGDDSHRAEAALRLPCTCCVDRRVVWGRHIWGGIWSTAQALC